MWDQLCYEIVQSQSQIFIISCNFNNKIWSISVSLNQYFSDLLYIFLSKFIKSSNDWQTWASSSFMHFLRFFSFFTNKTLWNQLSNCFRRILILVLRIFFSWRWDKSNFVVNMIVLSSNECAQWTQSACGRKRCVCVWYCLSDFIQQLEEGQWNNVMW